MPSTPDWDVIVIGGGLAGLSAAVYLGRALRRTLIIDNERSLAIWEPDVQNYLGFPDGISGSELLGRGRVQAQRYGVEFALDTIERAQRQGGVFTVGSQHRSFTSSRLLVATGLYHLPPNLPDVNECVGRSMFFCKDCDAHRVQGHRIAILGRNNDAVEYALGLLPYSPCVIIATNGKPGLWDSQHALWIQEYGIPVFPQPILELKHASGHVQSLAFAGEGEFAVDSIFTTHGDVFHNTVAEMLGAKVDDHGQILTDERGRTTVPGLYAAGCVTPANCQMIIAAGQGATAAQAINRELFEESLANHSLRHFRARQLQAEQTVPEVLDQA